MRVKKAERLLGSAAAVAVIGAWGLTCQPALAANDLWIGNTSNKWSDPNWSTAPVSGDTLEFNAAGSSGTSLIDDLTTPAFNVAGITFDAGAAAFIINPNTVGTNGFTLAGGITNNSTSLETFNDNIVLSAVDTIALTAGGGNVTFGGNLSGTGGLTTSGTGVLTLSGNNTYTGTLIVHNNGTLQLQANAGNTTGGVSSAIGSPSQAGGFQFGDGNNGSATLQLRSDSDVTFAKTTTSNNTGNTTLNYDVNNFGGADTTTGKVITVGGLTTFKTNINVTGGNGYSLSMPSITGVGGQFVNINAPTANFSVGAITGVTTLGIQGGRLLLGGSGTSSVATLQVGSVSGKGAAIYQSGTATVSNTNAGGGGFQLGSTPGAFGYYNMAGGTLNVAGELDPGGSGGGAATFGQFDMSSGTVNAGTFLLPNRGGAGEAAVVNISGGTYKFASTVGTNGFNGVAANWASTGAAQSTAITISGTGQLLSPSITTKLNQGANFNGLTGNAANQTALNLNGGTFQTLGFLNGATNNGNVQINFNGGTLKAGTAGNATFLANLGAAYIYGGGATIDDNGQSITIGQPLLTPAGSNGVTSIAVATPGAGYSVPPQVTISGGGGTGATGYATIDSNTGAISGIVVTNPGTGYTSAPTVTLTSESGFAGTVGSAGTVNTAANTGGGLTKVGAGTLSLSGASTYTGNTTVSAGTLQLSGSGAINGSNSIIVNGAGAKLVQSSSTPIFAPVVLTNGTLDGTGTVNTVTVGAGTGGIISTGAGTTSPLTIGSLTLTGAATINLKTSSSLATSPSLITTTLFSNASQTLLNVTDGDPTWANGTYDLISYTGALGGAGLSGFSKGLLTPAIGGRQSATLSTITGGAVNYIALTIAGDSPIWTGALNGKWTTATLASPKNWKLATAGTATDFITNDGVVFNDLATGTSAITISDANVSPSSVAFNNSTLNYSVSGPFGIAGTTGLVKTGSASLTLSSPNTYSGNTTLNGGTLNINGPSAIGTGVLNINSGNIDNTSGAAVALTTNNAQNWNTDFTFGGTNSLNLGTGAVAMSASRTVIVNGASTLTVGGPISGSGMTLTKDGPGTLAVSGVNTYDAGTTVAAGTLAVTGGSITNTGLITVGTTSGVNAVLSVSGGALQANRNAGQFTPSISIGSVAGGAASVQVTGGAFSANQLVSIGGAAGSYGAYSQTAGTGSSGSFVVVGSSTDFAVLNQSGGTFTINNNLLTVGAGGTGSTGVANFSGGTFNSTATTGFGPTIGGTFVGEFGTGVMNVSGTATVNLTGWGLRFGQNGGSNGTVNLLGGTISTVSVSKGPGAGAINFNGGTLLARADNANFLAGLDTAYVHAGGAIIDDGGHAITIAQPLIAPTGNGVSATGLTATGTGFIDTPVVQITGGGGSGATAVANINSSGALTGITITNPGVGYTSAPTFNIVGGGGTGSVNGTAAVVPNVGGGLTKNGAGITTLSAQNTYAGATTINNGTLRLVKRAVPVLVASYSVDNMTPGDVSPGTIIPNGVPNGTAMDGTAVNSGSSALSIVTGGPVINGVSGKALQFNGTGAAVDINSGITDMSGNGNWTASAWIQTDAANETGATIFSKNTNSTWGNGNSVFYLGNGTNGGGTKPSAVRYAGGFLTGSTNVADNNWHMVTYVGNGGTRSIYVDGVLETLSQTGFTTADIGNLVELGFTPDTVAADGTSPLLGNLADINFFDGALTPAQIQSLFTTNSAGSSSFSVLPATTPVNITASGAALDINGNTQAISSLSGVAGSLVQLGGGTLTVGDSTSTTFSGVISDTGGASTDTGGSLVKQGTGTLTLSGVNTYTGATLVNAGTLTLASGGAIASSTVTVAAGATANINGILTGTPAVTANGAINVGVNPGTGVLARTWNSLTIGSGGVVSLANPAVHANRTVLTTGSLAFAGATGAWQGKLDLGGNDLIVHNGVIGNVANQLKQGFNLANSGFWNGSAGIVSSAAANDGTHLTTLGTILNNDGTGATIYGTFDGQTVTNTDVLVKYTYFGDADLSGHVDGTDYSKIDNGFNNHLTGWFNGDFNYDGAVDGSDYSLIDNAFNTQGAGLGGGASFAATASSMVAGTASEVGSSAVPEPGSLSLLGIGAVSLLARRRRKA